MSIDVKNTGICAEAMAELENAYRYAAAGVRDPEVMRQACERMDRTREELRRKHGVVDDETFQAVLSNDELSKQYPFAIPLSLLP